MQEVLQGQIKAHSKDASVASLCPHQGGQRDYGIFSAFSWTCTCANENLSNQFCVKFSITQEYQALYSPSLILTNNCHLGNDQ